MYNVILSKKASNFIEKLDKSYKNKIKDVFLSLKENPFSYPHRKIKGEIYISIEYELGNIVFYST